jgi:AcrR family transcriptional regulator
LRDLAKARTRDAILDAALSCFSEAGLDAPSLDAICARAGCTRGAFYVHFKDRDDLIVAAMERRRGAVLGSLLEVRDGAPSLFDLLELFGRAVDEGVLPVPGAVRTGELLAACRRSKTIRASQLRLMQTTASRIEQLVRGSQTHGELRADIDPESIALLLLVLESGVELMVDLGYPLDIRRATRAFAQLLASSGRTG